MKTALLVVVVLALTTVSSHAQLLAKVTRQRFALPMASSYTLAATDSADNFVAAGSSSGKAYLTYHDRIGNPLWQKVLGLALESARAVDVRFDGPGNVHVLVNGREGDRTKSVVVKLDQDGNELYRHQSPAEFRTANRLTIDKDGAAIVTGDSFISRMQTYKVSPNGETSWNFALDSTDPFGVGFDVVTDPLGNVYVAGEQSEGGTSNAAITKLSGLNGGALFTVLVGEGSGIHGKAKRILFGPNDFIYFAGEVAREAGTFITDLVLFGRLSIIGSSLSTQTLDLGTDLRPEVKDLFSDGTSIFVAGNAEGTDDRPFIHKASLTLVPSYIARNDKGNYVGAGLSVRANALFLVSTTDDFRANKIRTRSYRITDGVVGNEKVIGVGVNTVLSGQAVTQDSEDNLTIVGTVGSSLRSFIGSFEQTGSESGAFRIKLSPQLGLYWALEQKLVGAVGGDVSGLVTDSAGNAYVAGSIPARLATGFVFKVSREGQILWKAVFSQNGNSRDTINDIRIAPDGNIVVAGTTQDLGGTSGLDVSVIKIDAATGARIWTQTLDGGTSANDEGRSLAISRGGDVFVTGISQFNPFSRDVMTFRLSGSTGALIWVRFFDSLSHQTDEGSDIQIAPNGNVVVVGISDQDAITLVYSNTGKPLWAAVAAGDDGERDFAIKSVSGADNSVFVAVDLDNTVSTGRDLRGFIRYSGTTGTEISRGFMSGSTSSFSPIEDIALDRDGNPLLLAGGNRIVVFKANASTGAQIYQLEIEGEVIGGNQAAEIVVDSEGRILALASIHRGFNGAGGIDFSLLRLKPTGALARQAFFQNVPGTDHPDRASQLALGVAGDVWAAGTAIGTDGGSDIVLLRYKQNVRPVARVDSYGTNEDQALSVGAGAGVLANDVDPNGDAMTARLVSAPPLATGTLTFNADGSFAFTPKRNFNGSAGFSYRAVDPAGSVSAITTVTINVAPVNDAPRAVADSFSVVKGQTLDIPAPGVLGNDTDVDGDALAAQLVAGSLVGGGQLVLRADGSMTYAAPDQSGTAAFTYQAQDPSGLKSLKAKVTITITD